MWTWQPWPFMSIDRTNLATHPPTLNHAVDVGYMSTSDDVHHVRRIEHRGAAGCCCCGLARAVSKKEMVSLLFLTRQCLTRNMNTHRRGPDLSIPSREAASSCVLFTLPIPASNKIRHLTHFNLLMIGILDAPQRKKQAAPADVVFPYFYRMVFKRSSSQL